MRTIRLAKVFCLASILSLAVVCTATAQQTTAPRSITYDAVVHSRKDAGSFPLPASSFTITDNKQPVTPLRIRPMKKGDEDIQVILVVDAVNTPTKNMGGVRQQLEHYLRQVALPYPTAFAIVGDKNTMMSRFSLNGTQLADMFAKQTIGVRDRNDEIGLSVSTDRLMRSIAVLYGLADVAAKMNGRTLLIYISPGWAYVSGPLSLVNQSNEDEFYQKMLTLSAKLRDSRVAVDAIDPSGRSESVFDDTYYLDFVNGAKKSSQMEGGHISLQALALQTGGRTAISNDLSVLMAPCLEDLHEYYEITLPLSSNEKPNSYHHLETKTNVPDTTVQARNLYYSHP